MTRVEAVQILAMIAKAVVETVDEAGPAGASSRAMYLAFMEKGMSLEVFEGLIEHLVSAGRIRRRDHVLYSVKATVTTEGGSIFHHQV